MKLFIKTHKQDNFQTKLIKQKPPLQIFVILEELIKSTLINIMKC